MSKDFDSTLSDALDLAASAARTAGPAAARARGRRRTVHRRIAMSTASLVVVALGATAAVEAASGGGGRPQLTSGSPRASASASASSTAGPTQSVVTSPSPTAPASSSAAATSSSPADSSAPAASGGSSAADPEKVVAGAWLSAGQMPFAGTFDWTAQTADGQSVPLGNALTPTVFYLPSNTSMQALTICADPTQLLQRTIGAQHTDYSAPVSTGNNQASQFVFFFSDDAAAQQTYKWLQTQYTSSCLLDGTGAQVTKTATDGTTGMTWLTLPGTSNQPDLPKYEREYFVLRGSTIAYVSVLSYSKTLSSSYDDASQLATIASHLCVYGGSCG